MNNQTVYVLGNSMEKLDSPAVKLIPLLRKKFPLIDFIHFDPTEDLPSDAYQDLILIDTVFGIDKVTVFDDLSYFAYSPRVTVHDYDLPVNIGLLQKLKKIKNITIIGIPPKGKPEKFLKEVIDLLYIQFTLRKCEAQLIHGS